MEPQRTEETTEYVASHTNVHVDTEERKTVAAQNTDNSTLNAGTTTAADTERFEWLQSARAVPQVQERTIQPPAASASDRGVADTLPTWSSPCSWWSALMFSWVSPLMSTGAKKVLEDADLWAVRDEDQSLYLANAFMAARAGEGGKKRTTLQAMVHLTRGPVIAAAFFVGLYALSQLAMPLLLQQLIARVQDGSFDGLYFALGLFGVLCVGAFCNQQSLHLMFLQGIRLRSLVLAVAYRKAIRLSLVDRKSVTVGTISNLVASDSQKFYDTMPYLHLVWAAPLQILSATLILLLILGPAALLGVALMVAFVPLSNWFTQKLSKLRNEHMNVTDERARLCTEVLQGIRVVKYFCWERAFEQRILNLRALEAKFVKSEAMWFAITMAAVVSFPGVSIVFAFGLYVWLGHTISAPDAFAAVALFNVLRFPLLNFATVLSSVVQCHTAVQRLGAFLDTPECSRATLAQGAAPQEASSSPRSPQRGIFLDKVTFSYGDAANDTDFAVRNITLTLTPGQLLAVVGTVGAGKSTLIAGILGETNAPQGTADVRGTVVYGAQEAWLLNGSLEDNVTFGQRFDEERFQAVTHACGLDPDIALLPAGAKTEIGERGVNVSGGQKQRVSLARVAYTQADIVLLDDPLSALDAHTGQSVFDNLIGPHGFLKDRARLLATHAVQYLAQADAVLVLHEGSVAFYGTFAELQAQTAAPVRPPQDPAVLNDGSATDSKSDAPQSGQHSSLSTLLELITASAANADDVSAGPARHRADSVKGPVTNASGTLMTTEDRVTGNVGLHVYMRYAAVGGGLVWFIVQTASFVLERLTYAGGDWWLSTWTSSATTPPPFGLPRQLTVADATLYSGVYIGFALANCLSVLWRTTTFARMGAKSAIVLFDQLLHGVLRSPMIFFETTPLGRIVTRFVYDTEMLDFALFTRMMNAGASAYWLLTAVLVLAIVTPIVLIGLVPVLVIYYFLQRHYRFSSRELQRLDNITRSPLQSHLNESMDGSATVHAFRATARFVSINDKHVDSNSRALLAYTVGMRWLGLRLELLGAAVMLCTSIATWLYRDSLSGGLAGMAILWAGNITWTFSFMVNYTAEVEAKMNSVERVLHYIQLPPEAELEKTEAKPPASWPEHGKLEFKGVCMRYRPNLPYALRDLTFTVAGGERVGVVGRTGAGKSSLAIALFRLAELAEGSIELDGVDLCKLGLEDVRGRGICIIPQDPVLFTGTIRSNLDPFDQHTDDDVWSALDKVGMSATVRRVGADLNAGVVAGGANYSVGERQLLCLARALLRKPRVLVLDEATASVDPEADKFIQKTIATCFDATLLTIAHRLHTIMDYDKVLVMDRGTAAEFGSPAELLARSDSRFSALVDASGAAKYLRSLVKKSDDAAIE